MEDNLNGRLSRWRTTSIEELMTISIEQSYPQLELSLALLAPACFYISPFLLYKIVKNLRNLNYKLLYILQIQQDGSQCHWEVHSKMKSPAAAIFSLMDEVLKLAKNWSIN